jgi:hypothetical protein
MAATRNADSEPIGHVTMTHSIDDSGDPSFFHDF